MSEAKRIEDQLWRALYGDAWHGPAVLELLDGIQAGIAAARPIRGLHSIWEIVLHIDAWHQAVFRRLHGHAVELPPEQDWPAPGRQTAPAWRAALQLLHDNHQALCRAVGCLPDSQLPVQVPGKEQGHSVYHMLHGVVQHDLYHAGQIALLKKAVKAKAPRR